jgi:hypothetical protein
MQIGKGGRKRCGAARATSLRIIVQGFFFEISRKGDIRVKSEVGGFK